MPITSLRLYLSPYIPYDVGRKVKNLAGIQYVVMMPVEKVGRLRPFHIITLHRVPTGNLAESYVRVYRCTLFLFAVSSVHVYESYFHCLFVILFTVHSASSVGPELFANLLSFMYPFLITSSSSFFSIYSK